MMLQSRSCRRPAPASLFAPLKRGSLLLAFLSLVSQPLAQDDQWPEVFDPVQVITLHLSLDTNDWQTIKGDTSLSINRPALFWAEGETNQLLIEVKRKSDPALGPKVSLKLDIDALVPGQEWRGLRKLSLENGNGGDSVVKEGVAHCLHRLAWAQGLYPYNPGLASWVRLYVNGEQIGVYLHAEERDKQFLKHRGMWKEGATWLYKNDPNPVIETGSGGDSPTYHALCFSPFRSSCPQPNLESVLPSAIDMEAMLTLGAIEAFTANTDGLFSHDGKNVFFVDFLATNHLRRLYFPWDLDTGLSESGVNKAITGFNGAYSQQILNHYWFRQWYLHRMTDLIEGPLSPGSVAAFLDQLEPALTPALLEDPNSGIGEDPADHFQTIRRWITNRVASVRAQIGPVLRPPVFNQPGGEIVAGFQVVLSHTNTSGTVYFTLDGTDPRALGGGVAPSASTQTPLNLTNTTHIMARVLDGTNWSALRQATFNIAGANQALKLTEMMYHPRPAAVGEDSDEYEFLEIKNTGTVPLDLSGCSFTGLDYRFRPGTILPAGAFFVLVRNSLPFSTRYPAAPIHGIYYGGLENSGEKIRLRNSEGNNIFSVEYDDDPPWPLGPDGFGYSLVRALAEADSDQPTAWRASAQRDGSPGAEDPAPAYRPGVVVNEVLAHTDPPFVDAVEFFNPTAEPIDISGWYLSDQIDNDDPAGGLLRKFRLPQDTVVPARGYAAVYETQFNALTNQQPFALSQYGDQVYLSSADAAGNLAGYIVGARFGASANGSSVGLWKTTRGTDFTALQHRTFGVESPQTVEQFVTGLGASNAPPLVGPVVLSEIMYHPPAGAHEFIEFFNTTDGAIDLSGWSLGGAAGFVFPANSVIPARGFFLLLGSTNIAINEFRALAGVPGLVPILAHRFDLQNDGEELELRRPNDDPTNAPIVVDRVRFNDKAPWPVEADGEGPSLERFSPDAYGNEPLNWRSAAAGGSPGKPGNFGTVIAIAENSSWRYHALGYNLGQAWQAVAYSDSGWPTGDGPLGYGPGPINTTFTNGGVGGPVTVYFRKEFVVSDQVAAITNLVLQASYNDGFAAYLNGQPLVSRGLPVASLNFDTLASPHSTEAYETIDLTTQREYLVRGPNVLAVEVHKSQPADPDLRWDAGLVYGITFTPPSLPLRISSASLKEGGLLLQWVSKPGQQYWVETTEDLTTWSDLAGPIPALSETTEYLAPMSPGTPRRLYRIRSILP